MPRDNSVRTLPDPVAIATKGRVTSQIKTQESSDKATLLSTSGNAPEVVQTRADKPNIVGTDADAPKVVRTRADKPNIVQSRADKPKIISTLEA